MRAISTFSDRRVKQCVGKTMRLAFISILRRLLGLQFGFLATICVQIAFFSCIPISMFYAVFICFLDGIVQIVVFLAIQG